MESLIQAMQAKNDRDVLRSVLIKLLRREANLSEEVKALLRADEEATERFNAVVAKGEKQ